MNRISFDWDNCTKRKVLFLKQQIAREFAGSKIELLRSPGGKGYHLKVYGKFTPLQNLGARAVFGDDPERIICSLKRYFCSHHESDLDIIFSSKNGNKEVLVWKNG